MSSMVKKSRFLAVRAGFLALVAAVITGVGTLISPHWCAEETAATMGALGSAWGLWPWLVARWHGICVKVSGRDRKNVCHHSCKDHR